MRLIFPLLFLLLTTGIGISGEQFGKILTILSTSEEETQMMALVLTTQAARQGVEARVLLCGEAGLLATEKGKSRQFAPAGRSPRDLVRELLAQGVGVQVCALFLPNRDLDQEDLLDGVTVAKPPEITALLLDSDTRLLSF